MILISAFYLLEIEYIKNHRYLCKGFHRIDEYWNLGGSQEAFSCLNAQELSSKLHFHFFAIFQFLGNYVTKLQYNLKYCVWKLLDMVLKKEKYSSQDSVHLIIKAVSHDWWDIVRPVLSWYLTSCEANKTTRLKESGGQGVWQPRFLEVMWVAIDYLT